jgi:alkylation response protein AidB-like acyl-CoA dehydrogenase
MKVDLSEKQQAYLQEFRAFAVREILPFANEFDSRQEMPAEVLSRSAEAGYFGLTLPQQYGGRGLDMVCYGLLHEQVGRGCSSLRSILTVHTMVADAILRWGSERQRASYLPSLASGDVLAALCLTEDQAGSDASRVETVAVRSAEGFRVTGTKKWVCSGEIAGIYLVLARCEEKLVALLIPRASKGLSVRPVRGMLGVRAAMLAEIVFEDCLVSFDCQLGRPGLGLSHVFSTALDLGRYSVAWGCVGIAQACLDHCCEYAQVREQFGSPLHEHQLVQQMLAKALVDTQAARLMALRAGYLRDQRSPKAILETAMAKYFASKVAASISRDAVQIHGANGCSHNYPVERLFRDAKIMEIIEGSSQILETLIARAGLNASFLEPETRSEMD